MIDLMFTIGNFPMTIRALLSESMKVLLTKKTTIKMNRYTTINYLTNNIVHKDVQTMLYPLNLVKVLSFTPRYRLKDDTIQPNTFRWHIIFLTVTLFIIILFIFRYIETCTSNVTGDTFFMFLMYNFDLIFYNAGFIMNYLTGLFKLKKSIEFVLIFQNVHRFINDSRSSKSFIVWNWIFLVSGCFLYVFLFTIIFIYVRLNLIIFLSTFLLIVFDLNEIYAIRVLKLLEIKIVLWSDRIIHVYGTKFERRNYHQRLYQAYVDILKCYNIHRDCVQYHVSVLISTLLRLNLLKRECV